MTKPSSSIKDKKDGTNFGVAVYRMEDHFYMRNKEGIMFIFLPYDTQIACDAIKQKRSFWRRRVWCVVLMR